MFLWDLSKQDGGNNQGIEEDSDKHQDNIDCKGDKGFDDDGGNNKDNNKEDNGEH